MQILMIILAAIALLGAGAAGGWKAASDHRDALDLADGKAKSESLLAAADAIAKIKVVQQHITTKGETIVRENTVYRDCRNTPEMVKVLNAAAAGGEP